MRKLQQTQRTRPCEAIWKYQILTYAFFLNGFFRKKPRNAATMNVSDRIINAAKHDCIIRCKLAGVSDMVAADVRYHLNCYIQFMRETDCEKKTPKGYDPKDMCVRKIAHEVFIGVTKGEMCSLLDVQNILALHHTVLKIIADVKKNQSMTIVPQWT